MSPSVVGSILEVDPSDWDRLAGDNPFVRHAWLASLELSGTATEAAGWTPRHLLLHDHGRLVAAAPLWVRHSSEGEFVWDQPIEQACHRFGRRYTPRAVVAVPWTPVVGRRLLTDPTRARRPLLVALAAVLPHLCDEHGWSGLNVHFCEDDEADALQAVGFFGRASWQYRWRNPGYGSMDDFLDRLTSRRRSTMRREIRRLDSQGIELEVRPGDARDFRRMAELYGATWRRYEGSAPVLGPALFERLGERMSEAVRFVVARRGDEVLGMTLNVVSKDTFYGRFWGCSERVPFLHFNVAYHRAIEHCIEVGLQNFDPGAGGEYKRARGFEPMLCRSVHWHVDADFRGALAAWAERETALVMERIEQLTASSPLR